MDRSMAANRYVLTDADANQHLEEFSLSAANGDGLPAGDWHVTARTLKGGPSHGISVVDVCNGPLTLSVMPTRGMSIWKGRYRELPLEWKSPVTRPTHPAFVDLQDRNGLGWLIGFNELFVRCGLAFNGPPGDDEGTAVTLHGRIANIPAHYVDVTVSAEGQGTISLTGMVDEVSLFGPCLRLTTTMTMELGSPVVSFVDQITNIGGTPTPMSLLYHLNIGRPFLAEGSRNAVAFQQMAPRDQRSAEGVDEHSIYEDPSLTYTEQAYYYVPAADEYGWSAAMLYNEAASAAFTVHYNTQQLPRMVVWKNTQTDRQGYVTGIEPAVNFPNFRGYERRNGRLPVLEPGATYRAEMRWELADTAEELMRHRAHIQALQTPHRPVIHRHPQPGWSPAGESAAP